MKSQSDQPKTRRLKWRSALKKVIYGLTGCLLIVGGAHMSNSEKDIVKTVGTTIGSIIGDDEEDKSCETQNAVPPEPVVQKKEDESICEHTHKKRHKKREER